jgi:trk system potassium uptake protein TrkA
MKIIVIGCGGVGAGLAQALSKRAHQVTVVDTNPDAFERLGSSFKGRTVLGIGFNRDTLKQAGVEFADGLAAVTSSDETNVVTAQVARQIFHVPRVVASLYDIRQAEIYKRLGIQTVAPTGWGINRIAELLLYSPLETVISIGSGDVEMIEAELPQLLVGKTVRDLILAGEIHVVAITRANKTFLPTLGTTFREGDLLHLAVLTTSANRLKELLGF